MRKQLSQVQIKSADRGEVSAVFSTFNVIDKDGDVTLPGAIKDGTEVVISAYGHSSHGELGAKLPVGKGVIRTTETEAILEGKFFLDTTAGRDTFNVVKHLGSTQEWSYSLQDVIAKRGEFNGQQVRFLEAINTIKEVSPVLIGAGVGTRTLDVKGHQGGEGDEPVAVASPGVIRRHETKTSDSPWVKPTPASSVDGLRFAHAWVDVTADPESPASYKFAHHDDDGANIRACVAGIALLVSGKHGIPEADVKGVYDHLAAHLRDAEREPVSLTDTHDDAHDGAIVKTSRELSIVLANVAALNDRMTEVGASRASRGKGFTRVQVELIGWLADELKRTQSLLDTPGDEALREYARFVALQNGEH